jgi:hypothetical protein
LALKALVVSIDPQVEINLEEVPPGFQDCVAAINAPSEKIQYQNTTLCNILYNKSISGL